MKLIDLIGIFLGTGIGILMNYFVIDDIEPYVVMYIRDPSALVWCLAAGLNILFIFVINGIAFQKINKTPLTDVTKY